MEREYNKLIINKLEEYISVFESNLHLCSLSFSEKNIHRIRVSIRRMLSLLSFINAYIPNPYIRKLVNLFKKKMKVLNPIRDTQVMILRVNSFERKYPDLQDFYFYLFKMENELTKSIKSSIVNENISEIEGNLIWLKVYLKDYFRYNIISDESFLLEYNRIKEDFSKRYEVFSINNDESIHYLRLAFKKLRYFLEVITELFPENEKEIKRLRKLQNTMGAIQDISVIVDKISLSSGV